MCPLVVCAFILSSTISGQSLTDKDKLTSVMNELELLKNTIGGYSELTDEMKNMKTRMTDLETVVEELKQENMHLRLKVQHLETQIKQAPKNDRTDSTMLEEYNVLNMSHDGLEKSTGITKQDAAVSQRKRMHNGIQNRQVPVNARVAFTAGISAPDLVDLGIDQTIIFDTTISNVGNAYHPHSGIFLTPVTGVYVFSLTLMVTPGHDQYLQIVVDGVQMANIYSGAIQNHQAVSSSKQWILEVNKDSEVWITTGTKGQVRGYMHTNFSGFLLYKTE